MSRESNIQTEAAALGLSPGVPAGWANKAGSADAVKCRFYTNDIDEEEEVFRPRQGSVMVAATLINRFMADVTQGRSGMAFAIAGGVAFKALNNDARRATYDVDVSFRGNKNILLHALLTRPIARPNLSYNRFVLPASVVSAAAPTLRIYLKVGPGFGDSTLREDNLIQVDILTDGGPSATGSMGFATNSVNLNRTLHQQTLSVHSLNVLSLLDSKLKAYENRKAVKDWTDIASLLQNHPTTISQMRSRFSQGSRRTFLTEAPGNRQVTKDFVTVLYGRTPSPESD